MGVLEKNMKEENIRVRRFSPGMLVGFFSILILIAGLLVYALFLPMVQQTAFPLPGEEPGVIEKHVGFWNYFLFLIIMGIAIILLLNSRLGGLKQKDREVLRFIYYKIRSSKKKNRYQMMKELRRKDLLRDKDQRQIYRIFDRLRNYGYIRYDEKRQLVLTQIGEQLIVAEN